MTTLPTLEQMLRGLIHTDEAEWQNLYRHLLDHLPAGLIIGAVIFRILLFIYSRMPRLLEWCFSIPTRSFILLALLAALAVRIGWMLSFTSLPWADGIWYQQLARSISEGKGFVWSDGTPTSFLPIGYPAILAVCIRLAGDSLIASSLLNLVLSLATVILVYDSSRRIWGEKTGRCAALFLALGVTLVAYVGIIVSEITATFFITLAIWLIVRSSEYKNSLADVLIGTVTGIAALTRPIGLLIPVALTFAWLVRPAPRWALRVSVICVFSLLVLVPNILRNYSLFGRFVPVSTNGGINFLIGNNPDATGYYMTPAGPALSGNEAEQSSQAYAAGFRWIRSNPGKVALLAVKKLFHLYHRDDSGILLSCVKTQTEPPWTAAAAAVVIGNLSYYMILVFGISYLISNRKKLGMNEYFLIFFCFAVTAFYLAYFGSHRFHIPLLPVFAGFAAAWVGQSVEIEEQVHEQQL